MVLCGLGIQQYAMHNATIQKTTFFELGAYTLKKVMVSILSAASSKILLRKLCVFVLFDVKKSVLCDKPCVVHVAPITNESSCDKLKGKEKKLSLINGRKKKVYIPNRI